MTFLLLLLLASLHNLSRTIGSALLVSVSGALAIGVMIFEMVVYHFYKWARCDYIIWVVGFEGTFKYIGAFVVHTVVKILVDFTGMVHARGPKLTGGALFSALTLVSQVYPFVALYFYDRAEGIENQLSTRSLLTVFYVLAGLWVAATMSLFYSINKEFWHTFYGTTTGWQFTIDCFRASSDPFVKMMTAFDNHISFTESIKDEVKAYVFLHWEEFKEQKPDWFTPGFIAQVPDWYIPKKDLEELIKKGGGNRRRKSVSIQDSVRSMRFYLMHDLRESVRGGSERSERSERRESVGGGSERS